MTVGSEKDTDAPEVLPRPDVLGINSWLVEEMYQEFRANPLSVSQSWRDFFSGPRAFVPESRKRNGAGSVAKAASAGDDARPAADGAVSEPAARRTAAPTAPVAVDGELRLLRGVPGKLAENMVASLSVPTATSVHPVPAKLLEVNRSILNGELLRTGRAKVSFTHLIGYAVVKALGELPALNSSFFDNADGQGTPGVIRHKHVGLGLAIDLEKSDGSRSLLVPVIKDADSLSFREFRAAYEQLVAKAHASKLAVVDFLGATVTITNPGTLGTTQSVPRLLQGQGAIIGVGALDYPVEFQGAAETTLAALGVGKVVTLTSTYDHRIIQGAESGLFLRRVHQLLVGEDGFYDEIFAALGVVRPPERWTRDEQLQTGEDSRTKKELEVHQLINMYRVRGHLIAQLDPLRTEPPALHPELDLAHYGLSVWDLDRPFDTGGIPGTEMLPLSEILEILRDAYCGTVGIEYMHIQDPEQKRWIQRHVEGVATDVATDEKRHIQERLNAAEAFETFLHLRYIGQKRFGLEGAESTIPFLDATLEAAAKAGLSEVVVGMAHRGRLNVLANIVGKSYGEIFSEFEGNLDPESVQGSGDVKYHKGAHGTWSGRGGASIAVTLASNPSHLEAVDPVVEGIARAKQDRGPAPQSYPVLPLIIHGDAAFAGQGVVAETLNLSMLKGYRTGGTVHLVINNQLGFTTPPQAARSSVYPTDIAKMVQAPIFHVNGDDPEACVRVAKLRVRVPPGLPQRRRHRPCLLPAARPQRGR